MPPSLRLRRPGGGCRSVVGAGHNVGVKVLLRNPSRQLDVSGPVTVNRLLADLDLNRESVLVVRNDTLIPGDATLADTDTIEIRPVISGGAA